MSMDLGAAAPTAPATSPQARDGGGDRAGVALMLTGAASNQAGAAVAALAFGAIGPLGVVAVRQWVAAVAMLALTRPRVGAWTGAQWRPVLALAVVVAAMNIALYTAVDRVGLGLAVTLEFLGPLAVALSSSRRALDVGCALVAGAGVVVLVRPTPSYDVLGIAAAFLAAGCWAAYILVNRLLGARVAGPSGPAVAQAVSALLYLPIGTVVLLGHRPSPAVLGYAATAGVLCSAVPFLADLAALRRVPPRVFGVFMSVNPVLAALAGWVVLGQTLPGEAWAAVGAIVLATAVGTAGGRGVRGPGGGPASGGGPPGPA